MWREVIAEFYDEARCGEPAPDVALAAAERQLGYRLPGQLRDLLSECDGVVGEDGLGLVWGLDRIVADNLRFRSEPAFSERFMPFEPLLFFADAGNGDQFAFPVIGASPREEVFAWNHVDDSRTWVAPDLRRYLEWWADGRIKT